MATTDTTDIFRNYDNATVFEEVQKQAVDPRARNFVLEFGPNEAKIAFNLDLEKFQQLVQHANPPRVTQRPVRWINIWGPNIQSDIVKVLGAHYGFTRRFQAILESSPLEVKLEESSPEVEPQGGKTKVSHDDDPERANGSVKKLVQRTLETPEEANHYKIAHHLINYQSLDLGEKFLCIGANFVYHLEKKDPMERLWMWLVLCNDSTVISLHEDPRAENADPKYMEAIRQHTLTILKQLSNNGLENPGTMSLVSVRLLLRGEIAENEYGSEGSSNLFYYLFDNWHSTYLLLINIQQRLEEVSGTILKGLNQTHQKDAQKDIIPKLYRIGKQLRRNQHLYDGYSNLIERILKFRAPGNSQAGKRVLVALRASERFERLGDRIKLLALSTIKEAIAEQAALLETYFNINAQNDSAATAKLSRNAALLSKLGVLFLPVSLMTSYFSVQIQDLQGVYTSQTYWICFAVIMTISFIALFFLSRVLVSLTETLEARAKATSRWCKDNLWCFGRRRKKTSSGASTPVLEKDL